MVRDYFLLFVAILFLPIILIAIIPAAIFGGKPKIIALGIDQFGGSVLYGKENLTVSSYTHFLCKTEGRLCWFEKLINIFFGKDHCKKSFDWEITSDKKELEEVRGIYSGLS